MKSTVPDAALLGRATQWREEFERLMTIIHEFPLTEEVKWGWPCYALENGNVVLIHGFKEYFALLFFKGAFEALTPGRQRAYNFYFSTPKQSKTQKSRVEKSMQQIFDGKGLND
jgi:uncharacterized protein YdeI (YjbR/CyaY-like superfamily)